MKELILGTRGSKLALTQSGHVAAALTEATGVPVRLQIIRTRGDDIVDKPLAEIGGKGLFTYELEQAMLKGEIHLAVHSLKDLPTEDVPGLLIAAYPQRQEPTDVLVGGSLDSLAQGAVVGTGSARRRVQLLDRRPDLVVKGIRGNVDTRLRKQQDGEYDAIVLAAAGLRRLELEVGASTLPVELCTPAPGQGCLGVQCAEDQPEVLALLQKLDHAETRARVLAERAFLAALGGGCSVPAGSFAWIEGEELALISMLADDAGVVHRVQGRVPVAQGPELGLEHARQLKAMIA